MNIAIAFGCSLLTGLTAVYCVLVWYGSGIWWALQYQPDSPPISIISLICLAPLPLPIWLTMIHWQLVAISSLVICLYWGRKRSVQLDSDNGYALPMAMHTIWILFAVCSHILGAMIPLLSIGHIIK
jgi:hypothetical protein